VFIEDFMICLLNFIEERTGECEICYGIMIHCVLILEAYD
jgi:hypothetical protein